MHESVIQAAIVKELTKNGWMVVKILTCTLNGWPDLQAHKEGRTVFIEVKAAAGIVAPLQQYRHRKLIEQGFEVIIARNLDHIKHLC